MSFPLVPKSVTLNDLERRNGRYIALFLLKLVNMGFNTQPRRSVVEFMHKSIVKEFYIRLCH